MPSTDITIGLANKQVGSGAQSKQSKPALGDTTRYQPSIPLKHIPRAWERRPSSPAVKHRASSSRKIWRRHDGPHTQSTTSANGNDSIPLHNARIANLKGSLTASHSPKKIVKKRCVHTSFGQTAKPNHWDLKASTPLRKKTALHALDRPRAAPVDSAIHHDSAPSPDTAAAALPPTATATAPTAANESEQDDDQDEWSDISNDDEEEEASADAVLAAAVSSSQATGYLSPLSVPTLLDASGESPLRRSSSAPAEHVMPAEARQKPRISDDTAILHAFLNRAAASKKPTTPIARRQSLTNRRDSDVVRQALASPVKTDVLADLDPNSPSPKKAHSSASEEQPDETHALETILHVVERADAESAAEVAEEDADADVKASADADTNGEAEAEADADVELETKPTRRSIRSRNRVVNLPPPSPPKHAKRPNKITIRSTGTPVAIQRTDAQELALVTRTNTRKNKGGSVMPVLRLCKLAAEAASPSHSEDDLPEKNETKAKRSIRWDPTLAYFQEFSDDSETSSSSQSENQEAHVDTASKDPALALTPMKSKVRRPRTPAKAAPEPEQMPQTAAPSAEPEKAAPPAAQEETTKAPAPKKRKSRIATPAKALLSNTCLFPTDATPAAATTPAAEPTPANKSRRSSARSLVPPKKPSLEPMPAPSVTTVQHADVGKENHLATPKKSGIPSVKPAVASIAVPKLESSKFEPELPGISSPAKKRPKTSFLKAPSVQAPKQRDEELPGLMSPAKKRVMRGKIF